MQLTLLTSKPLTKDSRRKVEKLIRKHHHLEAIIESKKMDLEAKMTVNYDASESQRGNEFHSETERISLVNIEIEEYVLTKRKLDLIYQSLEPRQKYIWDQRYILGRFDSDVYNDMELPDRTYYRLKKEMIYLIAEAFGFLAE